MGMDPTLAGMSRKKGKVLSISARCGKCTELQDISSKDEHLVPFVYDMICGKQPQDVEIIWDHYVRGDLGDDSTRESEQGTTKGDPSVSDS